MQLIFRGPDHPECSPHGPFRLRPTPGWKVKHSFIDFTSSLLIVRETNQDKSAGTHDRGMFFLQSQAYVLDPASGAVLQPDQWKSYFDYSTHVRQSDDGRFELTSQRVHGSTPSEERFAETLINLETGEEIPSYSRSAFYNHYLEDPLQMLLRREREAVERQAVLDA